MKTITQLLLIFACLNLSAQSTELSPYSIGEKHTIYSEILEEDREIIIHVPPGFWEMDENLKNHPITFVLDGESQFLNTVSAIVT
jgi:enterochelin esterase-like enzyme